MSTKKKHIVIIEDDPVLRDLTSMALSLEGNEINVFENGSMGIDYLENHLPRVDLILLDLFMPVLDGMQVLNWLRKTKDSSVNVVVMTAMTESETEKKLLEAGANTVLKKPLDIKMLLTATSELLDH